MTEPSRRALQTIGEKLLQQIEQEAAKKDSIEVSDETLLALYSVFGEITERALYLLESERIYRIRVIGSSRYIFKVTGKGNAPSYTLFSDVNFCQCPAYRHQVLNNKGNVTCKHILAVRLAKILKNYRTDTVTPQQFADIVMSELYSHIPSQQPTEQ